MNPNRLTDNIKRQLNSRNMSISELERRAGLKQSTLQNILNGRSKNPTIETIKSIAKELNCSIEELIGELHYFGPSASEKMDVSDDCPWDAELFIKAIHTIQGILNRKGIILPKKKVLASIDELYKYSIAVSDEIDQRFAEWIIDQWHYLKL